MNPGSSVLHVSHIHDCLCSAPRLSEDSIITFFSSAVVAFKGRHLGLSQIGIIITKESFNQLVGLHGVRIGLC
jgi:hypothetical protein